MFLHYPPGTAAWVRAVTDLVLIFHIAGGVGSVAGGVGAMTFRKGEHWHRLAGTVFFASMLTLGSTAAVIGVVMREPGNVFGGLFVCYLVGTAWVTARRREGSAGRFEAGAALLSASVAVLAALGVAKAAGAHQVGPTIVATAVMCGLAAIAAAGDIHVVLRHGLAGAQRVARHLWRMCVAFAMAAGAFVTQPSMFPHPMPVLLLAALAPLALMVFWLLVVALTGRFRTRGVGEALTT